ncbi:ComEC/Rec2 family competence protein [Anaeromicropila populeti]|uniref:ComEC/Rec2 family competence protein n=1 Tax=Anaeromicropila populeti TaxID=37658 RepID=UPI001FA8EBE4|nr:ComEC/Rec2 family competence protein [Anaeromicropila populeti]
MCLFFFQLLKKAGLHHFYASGACILLGIQYIYPVLLELFEELVKEQLRKRKETGIAEGGGLQKCLWNFCHWIALGVLMGFSIQMATLPVILWFFYEFPPFSPFLNLLVLPFTTVLILLVFLAGILLEIN